MGRKSKKALDNIILNIYRDLYRNSTPKADFDELVENATINEEGKKDIHYENYHIDGKLMDDIVEKYLKHYKLCKIDRQIVKVNVYLGCSPTSI